MSARLLTAAFLFSIIPVKVEAEPVTPDTPPIEISAPHLEWLLSPKHPGPYNDLMDEFFLPFGDRVAVSISPVRRALRQFFEGPADCFFAGHIDEAFLGASSLTTDQLMSSDPFNTVSIRAYTLPGKPLIRSLSDLDEGRIVIDLGIGGENRILRHLPNVRTVVDADNPLQAQNLLMQDRASAAIIMDYDYELSLAQNPEQARLAHDPAFFLDQINDGLLCKRSPETQTLIDDVNQRLTMMKMSGKLAELLQPDPERSLRQFAERPHPYLRLPQ